MSNILFISILFLILFGLVIPTFPQTRQFTFARDKWDSKSGMIFVYDKLEHAGGTAFLYASLRILGATKWEAFFITVASAILWEIKDAVISYKDYGWFGGDGFSFKDLGAGLGGMVVFCSIDLFGL